MKRIGNIFERIVEYDNLRLAFWKASRGKRSRCDQIRFGRNLEEELRLIRDGLINCDYKVGDFTRFTIYDPKEREICAATFAERVLQHAIMNVCEPYFDKWLIPDTYACRKGKGQVAAVKRAKEFASRNGWFMKCDIKKYFDSISHDKLKALLFRKFKDSSVLCWFEKIVDSYEKTSGKGLPIGSLMSQHFANLYLDTLDRFSTSHSGVSYLRYMDDFVFWSDSKGGLLSLRAKLTVLVREKLGLDFKEEPFINRTSHGMDFLGMRIFPSVIRLARRSKVRYRRKLKAYESLYRKGMFGENEYQSRLTALTAFTEQADARSWRRSILAISDEHRVTTVFCAGAAGTTTRGTAAPLTATGTGLTTATTTVASASLAPQHRRITRAVPADGPIPVENGTNSIIRPGASSEFESSKVSLSKGG